MVQDPSPEAAEGYVEGLAIVRLRGRGQVKGLAAAVRGEAGDSGRAILVLEWAELLRLRDQLRIPDPPGSS